MDTDSVITGIASASVIIGGIATIATGVIC